MPITQRHYKTKDVDMLIASATIIESAIAQKVYLQGKRPACTDPFFDDIKNSIDTVL